ncbi:MAG: type II toxin-antitoxin system VapC family toxin [Thermomicrobiales bacterium]
MVDSDVLIAHREGQASAIVVLEQLAPAGLAISIVTYMEVYQGTLRGPDPVQAQVNLAIFLAGVPVVPFSLAAARRCAELREELTRQGRRVRALALDLVTAAIALETGFTLVTRNRQDYEDISGLALYVPD